MLYCLLFRDRTTLIPVGSVALIHKIVKEGSEFEYLIPGLNNSGQ